MSSHDKEFERLKSEAMNDVVQGNIDRFSGFAAGYDKYRPEMPQEAIDIILMYLGRNADCVVDLGSGTGLSTIPWSSAAHGVVGIEPNPDMLSVARIKAENFENVRFIRGISNETGLESGSTDIVTCSQSFHWMEPASTLKEVERILRKGGVFAVYDCDWPVGAGHEPEKAYMDLFRAVKAIEQSSPVLTNNVRQWDKSKHLANIQESGLFGFSREIVFEHVEDCDSERFVGLALSQGGLQTLLKRRVKEIVPYIESLEAVSRNYFGGGKRKIHVGYRMKLAIK